MENNSPVINNIQAMICECHISFLDKTVMFVKDNSRIDQMMYPAILPE
jgi:hypothetical protein